MPNRITLQLYNMCDRRVMDKGTVAGINFDMPLALKIDRVIESPASSQKCTNPPLVVDLDGTLTATDTLVESIFSLFKKNPFYIFYVSFWLVLGRAKFKERVAEQSSFLVENLPWRVDFLDWLRSQHEKGRKIILATAAHHSIAEAVAAHFGFFETVISTSAGKNLKGRIKLIEIQRQVGMRFSYAGDSRADIPIWEAAETAILVGTSTSVSRKIYACSQVEREFTSQKSGLLVWMKALRIHQWLKNLLLFVPLFSAFSFGDTSKLYAALIAFGSFSLAASGTYIFNDLWDLENDRKHPRKKYRPFASAQISLTSGTAMATALLLTALVLAASISPGFAYMVIGYIGLTTAYSWALKQYVLIDVVMLALLYSFRILAGAEATSINVTPWLLAFSVFTFFGLALVKRCAELKLLQSSGRLGAHGRDYQVADLAVLWPLGIGASLCSIVIFGLYIGSPSAATMYSNTNVLWAVGIGLIYWNARIWIKTARGEMHDDPIVFAIRDFGSRMTLLAMLSLILLAHF